MTARRRDEVAVSLRPHESGAAGVFVVSTRASSTVASPPSAAGTTTETDDVREVPRGLADFAWLHARLQASFDGVIVPHLPAMALRGRLLHGFAYESNRLRGLERFVRQLARHPVLASAEETSTFLGLDGEHVWVSVRTRPATPSSTLSGILPSRGAADSTGAAETLTRWGGFKLWQARKRVNKSLAWLLNRDEQEEERVAAEDAQLERLQTYVRELQAGLRDARRCAQGVHDARRDCFVRHRAFQAALRELGAREGGLFGAFLGSVVLVQSTPAAAAPVRMGIVAGPASDAGGGESDGDSTASTSRRASDAGSVGVSSDASAPAAARMDPEKVLDEALADFEARAASAQRLVQLRRDEREAYEHAVEVYAKLRGRWEASTSSIWDAASGTPQESFDETAPDPDAMRLYGEISAAADALAGAQRQYRIVDRSTNDELRRLRKEMHAELCVALRVVAEEAAGVHARYAAAWEGVAERVEVFREAERGADEGAPGAPVVAGVATAVP